MFKTSRVAEILGLGTIRKANKLLIDWGMQKKEDQAYWPIKYDWGDLKDYFYTWSGTQRALKRSGIVGSEKAISQMMSS